ncbi:MAG: hypothetical protein ACK5O9_02940 [Holosporales bacterium]|jgi:hypothetical protein
MKRNSFNVQEPTVDVQAACEIFVTSSQNTRQVTVEIDASEEDLQKFEVYQRGDTVYVRQADFNQGSGGVTIIGDMVMGNVRQSFSSIGGGVVISGGSVVTSGRGGNINVVSGGRNVQIRNGRVIVDGKDVTDGGGDVVDSKPPYKAPKIRIEIPANSNLNAELAGEARLSCIVELNDTSLTCSHSAVAEIDKTHSADVDTSNGSNVSIAQMTGGMLNVNTANGSEVKIKGAWSQANVISSNGSSVYTSGTCAGNYSATGNNGSSIRHSGSVGGRIREKANNASSVNIG